MGLKITDTVTPALKKLQENAQKIDGTHTVRLVDLIPDQFVNKHTKFHSLSEMADAFGKGLTKEVANSSEWNTFVMENTDFQSWNDLKSEATKEYIDSQLFNGMQNIQ